jgi:hypothetical protein
MPTAAWATLGVAVAGLGVGTGFGAASLARTRAGEAGCVASGGDLTCSEDAREDARRSRSFAIVADISFAVGAAAAIAFVTLVAVAVSRRRGAAPRPAAWTPWPLGVRGRF